MVSCESSSEIKRRNVTTACAPCRTSKIKCDGLSPACTSCMLKGRDCHYALKDDRRKLSLRVAVEILADRVTQLGDFIEDNSLELPDMDKDNEALVVKILCQAKLVLPRRRNRFSKPTSPTMPQQDDTPTSLPLNSSAERESHSPPDTRTPKSPSHRDNGRDENTTTARSEHSSVNSADSVYTDQGYADHFNAQLPWGGMLAFSSPESIAESRTKIPGLGPQAPINDMETIDCLAEQLAARVGSFDIGKSGQIRYHGPTSNFNLVRMPEPDKLTIHRTVREHGQECLSALGLGQAVPFDLVQHLTNLFFTWQNPTLCIINRPMFEKARIDWFSNARETPVFSDALLNSICAAGATLEAQYCPDLDTFPRSLSDFFADRAKALLEIELDDPTVATVQAMVILSSHEIGCRRDTRGWLYSGMAVRLAFDLALHIDLSQDVAKGLVPQEEADLRRNVFWSTYNADCMWKYSVGRPCYINLGDVTISRPTKRTDAHATEEWTPYTGSERLTGLIPLPDFAEEVHRQRTILCEILAPLTYGLYGRHTVPLSAIQNLNARYSEALQNWPDNLPLNLKLHLDDRETKHLPHVFFLHIQYHQSVINVYRPFLSRVADNILLSDYSNLLQFRSLCIESAAAIAKLIGIHGTHYGIRYLNAQVVGSVCSAALMLIFALADKNRYPKAAHHLGVCLSALDELSVSMESARKSRVFLTLLQRQWGAQLRRARLSLKVPYTALDSSIDTVYTGLDMGILDQVGARQFPQPGPRQMDMAALVDSRKTSLMDWMHTGDNGLLA
ncbi:fungal-specific transcription factor domain-containing protein [Thelonectria olida]|uniref:Fungal-specific transcription factor domain-containing protein n=1 Tax=Thelonectria olida TaxID=1576542 RepID=A0A9P9ALC2_9HYPO|nr:fungal-specific transcription factor domain-containing protein [Thelonectria olida]